MSLRGRPAARSLPCAPPFVYWSLDAVSGRMLQSSSLCEAYGTWVVGFRNGIIQVGSEISPRAVIQKNRAKFGHRAFHYRLFSFSSIMTLASIDSRLFQLLRATTAFDVLTSLSPTSGFKLVRQAAHLRNATYDCGSLKALVEARQKSESRNRLAAGVRVRDLIGIQVDTTEGKITCGCVGGWLRNVIGSAPALASMFSGTQQEIAFPAYFGHNSLFLVSYTSKAFPVLGPGLFHGPSSAWPNPGPAATSPLDLAAPVTVRTP
ncbi:hypothetical protein C8R46DRAFT_1027097 [Mycena filopes]|nr:hypothetical protein C8R46DRAFT_1027097 [Mycena filopes]